MVAKRLSIRYNKSNKTTSPLARDKVLSKVFLYQKNNTLRRKQIMTNILKVGVMPGRIQEIAVDETVTIEDALALADLTAEGFEVKLDGTPVTDLTAIASGNVLLLTKKVKGN